jgi:anti-anti-sigma regulatory factor
MHQPRRQPSYLCTMRPSTVIKVQSKVGSNPNYRNSADILFEAISGDIAELVLDFSGVEFISRGFADELHKARLRFQAERNVPVVLEQVNEAVQEMLSVVARTQEGSTPLRVDIPVIRVNSVNELERMLLGC